MTSHLVLVPPEVPAASHSAAAEFIADRFSLWAFLIPVLWALVHRLWLEAGILTLITLAISIFSAGIGGSGGELVAVIAGLCVAMFVGLENGVLRAAALKRRGWREIGVIDAESADEAAIRYANAPASIPSATPPLPTGLQTEKSGLAPGPALGLLSLSDGRQ